MESVYLVCLIVGGFFVLLSIFGGSGGSSDADADAEVDADAGESPDHDVHLDHGLDAGHDGPDFVDLFSLRALFLFAAFFGLTGTALSWLDTTEPLTAVLATLTGLIVGLGGNYAIKRFAYEQVTSSVGLQELAGRTARVLVPFEGAERGKILLEARGQRLQLLARSLSDDASETFAPGDEVVVIRIDGRVAEVVKPE